ncbi:hypothetical protein ANN_27931 [Periplaneta americana]|uniref:DUF4817 domain-containing protein n=1 Tax=Periplaneta americana TaxID=6978 RepID=A0ABQ8RVR5_PERAM|nr:hypothetical protein ANN_27931 [Periplaneta americana]
MTSILTLTWVLRRYQTNNAAGSIAIYWMKFMDSAPFTFGSVNLNEAVQALKMKHSRHPIFVTTQDTIDKIHDVVMQTASISTASTSLHRNTHQRITMNWEELCDLDTIKQELKLEVATEENEVFTERKPGPSRQAVRDLVNKFQRTGNVADEERLGRPATTPQTVQAIQDATTRSPTTSTRRLSRELHVSQSTVWRTLRYTLKKRPYHIQILHKPEPEDFAARQAMSFHF